MPSSVKPTKAKRSAMPGADELFRSTVPKTAPTPEPGEPSGRVKHDEKITVYVTSEELLVLEQARLKVRAEVGRSVDRGRFVRAALAIALEDLENRGADSDVVQRIVTSLDRR